LPPGVHRTIGPPGLDSVGDHAQAVLFRDAQVRLREPRVIEQLVDGRQNHARGLRTLLRAPCRFQQHFREIEHGGVVYRCRRVVLELFVGGLTRHAQGLDLAPRLAVGGPRVFDHLEMIAADADLVAGGQLPPARHPLAVDPGAVLAAKLDQGEGSAGPLQHAVLARREPAIEHDGAAARAPDQSLPLRQLVYLSDVSNSELAHKPATRV
jgi:hypothetical protein